jgi:serine/threonine protein phosphatase PrpC
MSTGERTSETAVLTKQERERGLEKEPVNVGEPPIYSRKGVGSRERYDFCEDRKINDPNHGLFMVADGVSGSTGKVGTGEKASDMLARIVQQSLGAELDQELSVLARHPDMSDLQKAEKMSAEVNAKMRAALGLADHRIHTLQELNPLNKEAATTSTLAKIVDLPTGEKRLFLANIGDSRAFILRAGKLYRLTQDDSYASFILRSKLDLLKPKGTPQEIAERKQEFSRQMRLLEQAEGPDQLPANIRELYRFRNMITAAVGNGMHANDPGGNGESVRIESFVLEKGDRLMLASDGVTDQLLETEIEKITGAHTDDKQAERAIQEFADNVSLANDRPRAKADDISMVVHTVWQEKKPSMTDAPEQDKVKMEGDRNVSEVTNEQKQQWVERLRQLDQSACDRTDQTPDA